MNIKSFETIEQAKGFIAELELQGKSWHIVRSSFINVIYNY